MVFNGVELESWYKMGNVGALVVIQDIRNVLSTPHWAPLGHTFISQMNCVERHKT